jgi:hypothetical protein
MKKILLILSIVFSVTLFGQQDKAYYILDLKTINGNVNVLLENYTIEFSHNVENNVTLNERAKIRNLYFINVFKETSISGKSFYSMLSGKIAKGKEGHKECFGNPAYFKSPANYKYPEMFPALDSIGLKVVGEIMYQVTITDTLNEKASSYKSLAQNAIDNIEFVWGVGDSQKSHIKHGFEKTILKKYKGSEHHNEIIKSRGIGDYGSSTMVIITEKKLPNGKWAYEFMIRNLIIFTEPIN